MRGLYLSALIISIVGLLAIDKAYHLAFFDTPKKTLGILVFAVLVFIAWDVAGIVSNIFYIGSNSVLVGLRLGQFPIEELVFLVLMNYSSLIVYLLVRRKVRI